MAQRLPRPPNVLSKLAHVLAATAPELGTGPRSFAALAFPLRVLAKAF
ncbi:MAG: hypothetical protein JOZ69_12480 [Myxococcales bacterium]|nr:hypothetical protein [Myxococcales bacterium]